MAQRFRNRNRFQIYAIGRHKHEVRRGHLILFDRAILSLAPHLEVQAQRSSPDLARVHADCEQIVATALRSTIQIEGLGVLDVLGVLGILNSAAAEFAAARATKGEVEALREANNRVASGAR